MKLQVKIEAKTSYIHFWNYFSKAIIIQENKNLYPLIIVESEEKVKIYKKIFLFLSQDLREIQNEADLIELFFDNSWISIISQEKLREINEYEFFKKRVIEIKKWENYNINEIIGKLTSFGYNFSEYGTKWSYKKQGDILSLVNISGTKEYTISFWWEYIEEIIEKERKDFNGQIIAGKKQEKESIFFGKNEILKEEKGKNILEIFREKEIFIILDWLEFYEKYDFIITNFEYFASFDIVGAAKIKRKDLEIFDVHIQDVEELKKILFQRKSYIFTKNEKLIQNFIDYNNIDNCFITASNSSFLKSFWTKDVNYICDDIILKTFIKRRIRKSIAKDLDLLLKINSGDFVVHIDHGIGIFNGLVSKELGGITKEYIEILYKNDDKLFVPTTEIERISKYVWGENPKLTGLGTKEWKTSLEKAEKDIEHIAEELLSVYASRKIEKWFSFEINTAKIQAFQSHFPYIYTADQQKAIDDVLEDMETNKNMDRLLVGDVGFWKTEVAFNALYNSFLNKKQALLISPLVVLAYEHYQKALERFGPFGLKIGILTRLETPKKVSETLRKIASWELDIIVWTHKVLSEKIEYKNLGLIVIDEEHKFGVEDKEKIKKMRINIDCLSLSATPIPRSLNMALSGIRDISLLREAPHGRKDIKTTVSKFDEWIIERACKKEFERGGQVFFVHNRVENIESMKNILQKIIGDKKIVITHGQLQWEQLENRILAFKRKEYDVLLSTTVIENGIDFSNVNTIFINECQSFGLSQIHQLRGRVGRSEREGYCYLFYKKENLSDDTVKRLKTIVKYSYLGSWFELAVKDLEIRGGGDILGIRQSGQATEIGINLFLELLEDKIEQLKQNWPYIKKDKGDISIDLNISALIPDTYFNGEIDKINFYREIETIRDKEELNGVMEEFKSINPDFSPETENLFNILKCKILAKKFKIIAIKRVGIHYEIQFQSHITVEELKKFLQLDKEVIFHIVSIDKIRTLKKDFWNDREFLDYLLKMFDPWEEIKVPKKIKLKH